MGKLADNKTRRTAESVDDFIANIPDEQKRKDSQVIIKMMEKATNQKPQLWGNSLIGFGYVIIKSPSGREVEWFKIGFAPRKANLSLYLKSSLLKQEDVLKKLGKHKTGMGCLYINKLADIDIKILEKMITETVK